MPRPESEPIRDRTLTNNEVFALRERAARKGDRQLVQTIDRYLETQDEDARRVVLRALDEP